LEENDAQGNAKEFRLSYNFSHIDFLAGWLDETSPPSPSFKLALGSVILIGTNTCHLPLRMQR